MRETGEIKSRSNVEEIAISMLTAIQGGILLSKAARNSRPLELAFDMALAYVKHFAA